MFSITSLCSLFAQAEAAGVPWHQQTFFVAILAIAVIVVPFLIGQWLASNWRMSDDGWRMRYVNGAARARATPSRASSRASHFEVKC